MKRFFIEFVCMFFACIITLAWMFLILWLSSIVTPHLSHFLRFVVLMFAISLILGSIPIVRKGYRTMKDGWERRWARLSFGAEEIERSHAQTKRPTARGCFGYWSSDEGVGTLASNRNLKMVASARQPSPPRKKRAPRSYLALRNERIRPWLPRHGL